MLTHADIAPSVDRRLDHLEIAVRQLSLVTRSQFHDLAWTDERIRYRCRKGDLVPLSDRVFLIGGAPLDDPTRAMAGVLDAGPRAALARTAGLAWWGLRGYNLETVHVLRPHGPGGPVRPLGTVHQSRVLPPHHIVTYRSIPVTTPARTLLDVAETLHPGRLERTLESAWAERMVSYRSLVDVLETGPRTRVGHRRLSELVSARGPHYRPCESSLEMRVASLMTKEGMAFRRQVDSGGDDWIGRTDFRAEGRPLILEVQSERYHSTILDAASDAARTDALAAAGFKVVEVLESEIWYAPTGAVRRVRAAWDAVEHRSR